MFKQTTIIRGAVLATLSMLAGAAATAAPVYQPPGSNLTWGDVTHGSRVQSASSNPAAAAADVARAEGGRSTRGTVVSAVAGLEYGNVQSVFDLYDQITGAYEPSEPDTGGGGPGQNPDEKPDEGISIGDIWDSLDPNVQAAVEAAATEVAVQVALLALVAEEGYARAWLSADVPFVLGSTWLGGSWTFGANWSGSSRAFGVAEEIEFNEDEAVRRLESWVNDLTGNRAPEVQLSDDVILTIDQALDNRNVNFVLRNDSSIVSKSTQTTELSVGYSLPAWTTGAGTLFVGAEAHLYMKRLSRLSVRFGDITDSEELFDSIRNADFVDDEELGLDIGALWVARHYQLGAQLTSLNEPEFTFPDVNLEPYTSPEIIAGLMADQIYVMDRQLKLEASVFTEDRRWSVHLGFDADSATDPLGDEYQWATLSAGWVNDSFWVPSLRVGYRQNLVGTELGYLSIGATLFKYVNIDLASAFDSVTISGTEVPQGLMGSIGFQIAW